MYLLAHASVVINCPQHVAFAYTANLENFPSWFPGVLVVKASNDLPFDAVGKQYQEEFAAPVRGRRSVKIRVVDAVYPSKIVTEGTLANILPRMEIAFRQMAPGTCEVDWRMFSRRTTGLTRWLLLPIARRVMTLRARQGVHSLKLLLEGKLSAASISQSGTGK